MKNLRLLLLSALLASTVFFAYSQDMYKLSHTPASSRMQLPVNYVKVNITSVFLKNYGIQYERVLNQHISMALAGRIMPASALPFKSAINSQMAGDDPKIEKLINESRIGNYAITPEVKIYLGKGYGQGAYISFFYRYLNFNFKKMPLQFDSDLGDPQEMRLTGELKSNTGGFLLGWQKVFGNAFTIDIWFLGPHVGKGKGVFSGKFSRPLTSFEQDDIRQSLSDLDIPIIKKEVNVNQEGATYSMSGLWGGVRSGISLGVRF